jgi:predicted N-acyltransferase
LQAVRVFGDIASVPEEAWDRLVGGGSPFLEHRWLRALEESGCVDPDTGWVPRHVTVWRRDRLVAAAPAYVKLNSMGEFVYDWSWAHAARQVGVPYYPKLIVGVPFTPVTGQRLLVEPGPSAAELRQVLVAGLQELARQLECSGLHVLFPQPGESVALEQLGGSLRLQSQFHWTNHGYSDFEDFLARAMKGKRRGEVRRERRRLAETGVTLRVLEGEQIDEAALAAMQGFYTDTCWKFGGRSYLNPDLWAWLFEGFRDRLHLVLAYDQGRPIAGALNVQKGERLYGRYWGCSEERPYLHFEVCYYRAIEHCIERGLSVFEPGHGGGHKYPRGFEPTLTRSNHWLADPRLAGPIESFLVRERAAVRERVSELSRSALVAPPGAPPRPR